MSRLASLPEHEASSPPRARRRPRRSATRGIARLVPAALLGALAGVVVLLLTSPTFVVAEPVVVGQHLVDASAIASASGVGGQSILLIDRGRAERGVLDLRPIASARVDVALPNVVTISVVERRPMAVWRSAGAAYLVDAEGIVLSEMVGDSPDLTIEDVGGRRLFVGAQVDGSVVKRAAALRDGLSSYQPKGAVFAYSQTDGLSTSLTVPGSSARTVRVLLGQDDDVATRLEVWRRLAAEIGGGRLKAETVDLRIADRPFVK